jgi:hypothetical protein
MSFQDTILSAANVALALQLRASNWRKLKKYEMGWSHGITSIPDLIKIIPLVLDLKQANRQWDG